MRIHFSRLNKSRPVYPQGKVFYRLRPIASISFLDQSNVDHPIAGTIDTGADDTILPLSWARKLGVELVADPDGKGRARGADVRGPVHEYGYGHVTMCLSDETETFIWPGIVGFSEIRDDTALFGLSGVVEYFDVVFRGRFKGIDIHPGREFLLGSPGFFYHRTERR